MSVLRIRLADEKHERLRRMAEADGVSMNSLFDEWAKIALAQHDAEVRFRALGGVARGLAVLNKIDRRLETKRPRK